MIRIGIKNSEKDLLIQEYIKNNPEVEHVIVFSPEQFRLDCEYEQYGWDDVIMYKYFYPLLEKIDNSYLLVINEMLRTANRSELTYSCLRHYLNQTPHRLIVNWFPMINDKNDFMVLLDLDHPGRFKGIGYSPGITDGIDVQGKDRRPEVEILNASTPERAFEEYAAERDRLFDSLGNKDPDTIPRRLHLYAGRFKEISAAEKYVARNKRFKAPNVTTYKDAPDGGRISIDIPFRRLELNDYLFRVNEYRLRFLATQLKVDQYYAGDLARWDREAGELIAEAGIYPERRRDGGA